ncbi:MAG: DUF190 domain-containing protein [Planctomycetes bacterium]|nr:DUF190 domain-containing protein [Planctomycetota bacterium]
MLQEKGKLLRIFLSEDDKHHGKPLYEWIVQQAKDAGLAGATVLRGMEGFGANRKIHTAKVLRLSIDLPMVIEIIDTPEKIKTFLPVIDENVKQGLATLEDIEIHFYRTEK